MHGRPGGDDTLRGVAPSASLTATTAGLFRPARRHALVERLRACAADCDNTFHSRFGCTRSRGLTFTWHEAGEALFTFA